MPFTTGSSTSLDDFISQMLNFAVANAGFTLGSTVNSSAGSGSVPIRHVVKGGVRFVFFNDSVYGAANGNIKGLAGFMSYTAPTNGISISSNSTGTKLGNDFSADGAAYLPYGHVYAFAGPYTAHWFFTDGTVVNAVLQLTTGLFMHVSFGSMTKFGTWTGGEFMSISGGKNGQEFGSDQYCSPFSASYAGNYDQFCKPIVRINNANVSADFLVLNNSVTVSGSNGSFTVTPPETNIFSSRKSIMSDLLARVPATSAWRTIFTPIIFFRGDGSTSHYPAGIVPNVVFTKLTDVMVDGQLIETDWRIFPLSRRAASASGVQPYSDNWAIAYREVA